ncbi:TPA_asm: UL6.5 sORF 2 [Human alphaherpesvirus 1]|nr:TPA_asm: UL6.5 sORF 2 [Human alphaherpesvirus 1]
MVPNRLFI